MDFRGTLICNQNVLQDAVMGNGTSYPGSPVEGQFFYRSDLDTVAVWDGAAWVVQATEDYVDTAIAGVGGMTNRVESASFTAAAGDFCLVSNATGTDIVVTLPNGAADGDTIAVAVTGRLSTGTFNIVTGTNSFVDGATTMNLSAVGQFVVLRFDDAGNHWIVAATNSGAQKFTDSIGDGATDPLSIVHGLGTLDVSVTVYEIATGLDVQPLSITRTDFDTVAVSFAVPATADQYRIVVRS